MPRFQITETRTIKREITVEAPDKDEALRRFHNCEYDPGEGMYADGPRVEDVECDVTFNDPAPDITIDALEDD